jgi:uncharacterized repeat protein (TIGR01451 family)/uncharacterized delta-60 repeat protein
MRKTGAEQCFFESETTMLEPLKTLKARSCGGCWLWLCVLGVLLAGTTAAQAQATGFFAYTNWKTNESAQIISTNKGDGFARVVVVNAGGLTLRTLDPTPINVSGFLSFGYIEDGSDLAQPDEDYVPFIITVPNNPNPYTHSFRIINDDTVEFNEDILLALIQNNVIVDIATVTIEHDDPPAGAVDVTFMKDPPYDDTNPNPGANNFVYAVADGFTNRLFNVNSNNFDALNNQVILGSHGLHDGADVILLQQGTNQLPAGLVSGRRLIVTNATVGTFELLNPNGAPVTFNANNLGSGVNSLLGYYRKSYIGGDFTSVNGSTNKVRIARLNLDGTVDFGFDVGTGADSFVTSIGVATNGNVMIGGAFSSVNGFQRHGVARLRTNGVVDASFNPGTGARLGTDVGTVRAVAVYTNGIHADKTVIGGEFTTYNGSNRAGIARLNADGSLDTSFDVGIGADGPVYAVRIQADGKVVIGGDFTSVNGVARNRIARLTVNGAVDDTFNPGAGADDTVYALGLDRSNPPLVFNRQAAGGQAEDRFVINAQQNAGVLTINYNFLTDPDTLTVYYPPQGQGGVAVLATGLTNGINTVSIPFSGAGSQIEIVINEGGNQIATVQWFYDAIVTTISAAEKVVIGGAFQNVDLRRRSRITRLNADGSLDLTYSTGLGFDDTVFAIGMDPLTGGAVVGGLFTSFNSTPRTNLARVRIDGALDTSFMDTGYNQRAGVTNNSFFVRSFITAVGLQTDGNVLIGGGFTGVGGDGGRLGVGTDAGGRVFIGTSIGPTWPNRELSPTEFAFTIFSPRSRETGGTGGTRWGSRVRNNVARVHGGTSPAELGLVTGRVAGGPGNMQFISSTYNEDENGTNSIITVQRVNGRLGSTTVGWATSNLTATAGLDYSAVVDSSTWLARYPFEGVRMFSSGDLTNKNFRVPILEDTLVEGNEDLLLQAINPVGFQELPGTNVFPRATATNVILGAAIGARGQALLTITDNDFNFGEFNFATTNFVVNENAGSAVITVTRTGGSVGAVSINYATTGGGTATAGSDYTPVSNTLTFAPGQTVRTFTVPIVNDTAVEFDETVNLVLFNPTGGATLGPVAAAVLNIRDDDNGVGTLQFSTNQFFVSETGVVAVVTVQRTSGSAGTVTVNMSTSDGTAVDSVHYAGVSTNITFGNGVTSRTVAITIFDDGGVNADRTINLALGSPGGGALLGGTSNAVLTVVNDDAFGELAFSTTDYFVNERGTNTQSGSGTSFAVITVIRKNGSAGVVSVDFATVPGGTATPGADFVNTNRTLVFNPGQLIQTVEVPILNDPDLEAEETVFLNLVNPVNGTIAAPNTATLTIVDDESSNFPAGTDDTFFNPQPGPDNFVYSVAVQPDRKLVAGGAFRFFNGSSRNRIVRVNTTGTLDTSFNPGNGANDLVRTVVVQPDGRVLMGGNFTVFNATNRNYIARLNADGSLDPTFSIGSGADNPVLSLALHTNGLVVLGGEFTFVGGLSRNRVAVLNTNGTINTSFNPGTGANGTVRGVTIHTNGPDAGKIVIVGDFSTVNGTTNNRIARLNLSNGSLDTAFGAALGLGITNGSLHSVAIHPNGPNAGKIVVGGIFSSINGVARTNIARLNADGSVDTSFASSGFGPNGVVFSVAIDDDGRVLVGGEFTAVGGIGRNRFARLNANGTLDTTINTGSGANSFVASVATKPDQKIAIGGGFTIFNEQPHNYLVQILGGTTPGAGVLEFRSAGFTANESDTVGLVTVSRNGGQDDAVSVNFNVVGGTAVAGQDYTNFSSGTLFLTNGQTSALISVPLVEDKLLDGDVTILLQLSNPTNISQGGVLDVSLLGARTNATLTILDNDSVLSFSAGSYSVSEGAGAASITVVRSGGLTGPVSVRFSTADGTALTPQDYTAVSGTLSFASGESSKTFSIPLVDDALIEGNEFFTIQLTNVVGEAGIIQPTVDVTIVDNDFNPGTLNFLTSAFTVDENAGSAVITVTRTNGSSGTITVQFSTSDGTALAGADYLSTNGVLTFADGEVVKTFEVPILPDAISTETNETVNLILRQATGGATIGQTDTAILTIINNNAFIFGGFRFSTNDYAINEPDGAATITIQRTGGSTGEVSVTFFTMDGTAAAGLDYTAVTNLLVFAEGQTSTNISIPIINEFPLLAEGPETITLTLTNPTGGASLAVPSVATLTILDDDFLPGSLTFLTNSYVANETTTNAVITVLRTNGSTGVVTVDFAATDGTARNGVDYVSTNGTLTFADGVTSNAFLVPLIHNPLQRGNFNVLLNLGSPSGGAVISTTNALLTILDNEPPAGTVDNTFSAGGGANGTIYTMFLNRSTGRITLGGDFNLFDSTGRTNAARLNADGSLDSSFAPPPTFLSGTNASVRTLSVHTNGTNLGKVVIGGLFDDINSAPRRNLARLNSDGTLEGTNSFAGFGANSTVTAVFVQNNGRILVGGSFTTLNGTNRNFLARLEGDGLLDLSFNIGAGANGAVRTIAVDPSGRILIGGDFTVFNGVVANRIARLNPDGSLDKTFDVGTGPNAPVRMVVLQPDGRVLVGGEFTSVAATGALNGIARLNADGGVDTTFMGALAGTRGGNDFVHALAVQTDGRILVGGAFTTFHGFTNYNRLVRLHGDGSLDTTFNTGTGFNDFISSIVVQTDGKLVVAGAFTSYDGSPHNRIVRLNGGENVGVGNLEFTSASYFVDENAINALISVRRTRGTSNQVSIQFSTADGTALAGTHYNTTNGVLVFGPNENLKSFIVRVLDNTNVFGNVTVNLRLFGATNLTTMLRDDSLFGSQTNAVLTIVEDDGVIGFASPSFSVNENAGQATITVLRAGGTTRQATVDFTTTDGTALAGFDYATVVTSLTFLPGQTAATVVVPIINDSQTEGNESIQLSLLNPTNTFLGQSTATLTIIDDEFQPGVILFAETNYTVLEGQPNAVITVIRTNGVSGAVSVQYGASDGTAISGEDFLAVTNTLTFADGEASKTFLVPIIDDAVEDDGETVLLTLSGATGGATLAGAGIFGQLDTNFNLGSGPDSSVLAATLQTDGSILIGGAFFTVDGLIRSGIARLGVNGSVDSTFDPIIGFNSAVTSIAVHTNGANFGRIVVGGFFTAFNTNGVNRIARLQPTGALDTTFNIGNGFNGPVLAVAIYPFGTNVGKVLVGGSFTQFDGNGRNRIARLNADGTLDTGFTVGTGFNGLVTSLAIDPLSGQAVVGGFFSQYDTNAANSLALLDGNGSYITNFTSGLAPFDGVLSVALSPGGSLFPQEIVVGGSFLNYAGIARTRVARIDFTGALDATFDPGMGPDNSVFHVAVQPDRKVVISGAFTNANGFSRNHVERLDVDGARDRLFDPGAAANANVNVSVVQPDGRIVIGGDFTMFNGTNINRIARLEPRAAVGLALSLLTITDNDVALGFTTNAFRFSENSGVQVLNVQRTGLTNQAVTVDFFTEDGTAFGGLDYAPAFTSLTFGPGETNKLIVLTILDDSLVEGDETFTLRLTNSAGVSLVGFTSASVTITDDDVDFDLVATVQPVEPVYATSNFIYVVSVTNRGPSTVTGVTLTNALPGSVTFLGQSNSLGVPFSRSGNVISYDLGTLSVGTVARFFLTNTAPAATGSVTNVASVLPVAFAGATDRDANNNVVTNVLLVRAPSPFIANDPSATRLISESRTPANGAIDPGETVTLNLALRNIGNQNTAGGIVAALQPTGEILSPSGAQSYGPLAAAGAAVSRPFTFTVNGTNGQTVSAFFNLTDNGVFLADNIVRVDFVLGATTNFASTNSISLPDSGTGNPYPSTLTVSGLVGIISKVTVTLSNVHHTFPADLDLLLVSPSGEKVIIMSDVGAAPGQNQGAITNVTLILDDDASFPLPSGARLTNGTYKPANYDNPFTDFFPAPAPAGPYRTNLAAFNGREPNGVWSLYVVDDTTNDFGGIAGGWSLNITAVTPVSPTAGLALGVTVNTNAVFVGSNVVYTILVTNLGPEIATGVNLTNALPAGATLVSATNDNGGFGAVGGTVVLSIGTLNPGAVSTNRVEITARVAGTATNLVTVAGNETDPFLENNTERVLVAVTSLADISISQNVPAAAAAGALFTNVITVANLGPSTANNVVLTSTVPASVTVTSTNATQGSVARSGNVVTANLGTIASNGTAIVRIVMRSTTVGTISLASSAGSSVSDLNLTNNTVSSAVTVTPDANLAIGMTAAPDPVVVNSNLTYSISITNLGPSTSTNVVVTDVLPGSLTFVSATPSQGSVSAGAGTVTWTAGNLLAGATATLTLRVSPTAPGTVNNTATVTASTGDSVAANNSVTVTTTVNNRSAEITAAGALLISEANGVVNGQIDPGETVTVALALRNKGGSNTVNLVATLLQGGGVTPTSAQSLSYGVLEAGGESVTNSFSFTASGAIGGVVSVSLALQDGATSLGTVTFPFNMGVLNTFSNSAQIVIQDLNAAAPYPSTISVSNLAGAVLGLTVTLHDLVHSYPDDIDLLLVSPGGLAAVLMSDAGGGFGLFANNPVTLTLDDAAANSLPNEGQTITNGTYRPSNYPNVASNPATTNDTFAAPAPAGPYGSGLSTFGGANPNGAWQLFIMDDQGGDDGVILNGWSMRLITATTVSPSVDLAVTPVGAPEPVHAGSNLTYSILVTNRGPNAATNVIVTAPIPAGSGFVSAANPHGSFVLGGGTVTFTTPTLEIGARATNTLVVTPAALGTLTLTASVSSAQVELVPADNTGGTVNTVINLPVDLAVGASASTNMVAVSSNLTYTLLLTNLGPNIATGARITNMLHSTVSFVSATPPAGGSVSSSGQQVIVTFGSLASNASASAVIVARPNIVGLITNLAVAGIGTQTESNLANNTITIVTTVDGVQFSTTSSGVTNGAFGTMISGRANRTYVVEASTNLVNWVPVFTNSTLSGAVSFIDTNAPLFPTRFYRAVER